MKKFYIYFLMAVGVIALGTVSSCKDYDDDRFTELNVKNMSLEALLEKQKNDLQAQIDLLNAHIANCKCDENYNELKGDIADLLAKIADLQSQINDLKDGKADKTELESKIQDLQNQINELKGQIPAACDCSDKWEALGTRLDGIDTAISNLQTAISNKVDVETFDNKVAEFTNEVNKLNDAITDLTAKVTKLENEKASIEQLNAAKTELENLISALRNDFEEAKTDLLEKYTMLYEWIGAVQGRLDAFGGGDETIEEVIGNLHELLTAVQTEVTTLKTEVGEVKGKAEANESWINTMKELYGDNLENLASKADLNALQTEVETLKTEQQALSTKVDELTTKLNELAQQHNDFEELVRSTVDDLQSWIMNDIEAPLKQDIYNLKEEVNSLKDRMQTLETEVSKLNGLYENLANRLNSQITSILVQSVTTPLFMDVNVAFPINVQSNIICAYYGRPSVRTDFPTVDESGNLSDDDEALTEEEVEDVEGYYSKIPSTLKSNAGKVYLTINPSTVNFTGAGLKLVDSQNGASGFEFDNVKKSSKVLSFMSRSVDNGFYEADVKLSDVEAAKFNTTYLKDAAGDFKTLWKNRNKGNLKEFSLSVLKAAAKSAQLTAYAVQAPYTYKDENGNEVTAYVHSNYNIAATAVHPLSYNMASQIDDLVGKVPHKKLRHIPYLSEKFKNLASWGEIKGKLYFEFDDVDYTPKDFSFTIPEFSLDEVNLTATATGITYTYEQPTGWDPITNDFTGWETKTDTIPSITVPINGEELKAIEDAIQDQILDDLMAQFNKLSVDMNKLQIEFVNAINQALQNTADMINTRAEEIIGIIEDLLGKTDRYFDRANSLIDRINNVLESVYSRFDNAGHYIMPVMFYGNANNTLRQLSSYESSASYVKAGYMTLYPTSYTAELLNPAAKKCVMVTKAKKLSTGVNDAAEVAAANQSLKKDGKCYLNKVLDGNVRAVGVQLKSGYAYEFAYTALDYSGYQITQRYWVKVK